MDFGQVEQGYSCLVCLGMIRKNLLYSLHYALGLFSTLNKHLSLKTLVLNRKRGFLCLSGLVTLVNAMLISDWHILCIPCAVVSMRLLCLNQTYWREVDNCMKLLRAVWIFLLCWTTLTFSLHVLVCLNQLNE